MLKQCAFYVAILFFGCGTAASQNSLSDYDSLKTEIKKKQELFKKQYKEAKGAQKDSVVKAATDTVFRYITNDYFSFWHNTPWEFYGTTRTPKQGAIACGYFVTTVLEDAGFNLPRVEWAKAASETMIMGMTKHLKRFRDRPVDEVEKYIKETGKGLYVVGLDNHTGFIYNNGEKIFFVHSNYYQPTIGVMTQPLDSHNPLKYSKYRVVGKILDAAMMQHWILGTKMK